MKRWYQNVQGYILLLKDNIEAFFNKPHIFIETIIGIYVFILLLWGSWTTFNKFYNKKNVLPKYDSKILYTLHKAVVENDVIRSIRITEKYPGIVNVPYTSDGYTPFLRACLNGNTQLVTFMLCSGANINTKSAKNETPFYLAVFDRIKNADSRDASCMHALYHAGADINAPNDKGYNSLQLAAMFGHTAVIRWLLAKGANTQVQPDPYLLARSQGHYEAALVLKNERIRAIEQT